MILVYSPVLFFPTFSCDEVLGSLFFKRTNLTSCGHSRIAGFLYQVPYKKPFCLTLYLEALTSRRNDYRNPLSLRGPSLFEWIEPAMGPFVDLSLMVIYLFQKKCQNTVFISLHWEGTNFFFLLFISNIVETSAELRQKFPPPPRRFIFLNYKAE